MVSWGKACTYCLRASICIPGAAGMVSRQARSTVSETSHRMVSE